MHVASCRVECRAGHQEWSARWHRSRARSRVEGRRETTAIGPVGGAPIEARSRPMGESGPIGRLPPPTPSVPDEDDLGEGQQHPEDALVPRVTRVPR